MKKLIMKSIIAYSSAVGLLGCTVLRETSHAIDSASEALAETNTGIAKINGSLVDLEKTKNGTEAQVNNTKEILERFGR